MKVPLCTSRVARTARIATVLAVGAVALMLEAACARSVDGDLPETTGFAPTNPAPLTACVETSCPAPWATCPGKDGLCTTDTSRDVDHCGACGNACPQPQRSLHSTALCSHSACAIACDPLFADCNHDPVDGCEVSVADDPKNCGGCGLACKDGEICWRGACGCPKGFATCGNECVDTQNDDSACGACDKPCQPPDASSPEWKCGPGVQPPQTTWGCTGGGCKITCKGVYGDCNDDLCKDGCETDLDGDPKNCGACGHACDAGQDCLHGTCICPPGTLRCGDRCVDPNVDIDNCGGCNDACPGASDSSANGAPTCVGGHCGYVCYAGFADCNHRLDDGCEVNVMTDQRNCGGCGTKCNVAEKQPCVMGVCLTKPCDGPESTK